MSATISGSEEEMGSDFKFKVGDKVQARSMTGTDTVWRNTTVVSRWTTFKGTNCYKLESLQPFPKRFETVEESESWIREVGGKEK